MASTHFDNFDSGSYSEALKQCDSVIFAAPTAVAFSNRAVVHLRLELLRKAIKDCDEAIRLDPYCLRAYITKGHALIGIGKKDDAVKCWAAGLTQGTLAIVDIELHAELRRCLTGAGGALSTSSSAVKAAPSPVATPPPPSSPAPAATPAASKPLSTSADTPIVVTRKAESGFTFDPTPATDKALRPEEALLAAAQVAKNGQVQHASGTVQIDERIALGYLKVNTGHYKDGIEHFGQLLSKDPRLVAALLGRGTAYALIGDLERAIQDFSSAIDVSPTLADAWKRRGQSRAARGLDKEALADFGQGLVLDPKDADMYHQRGLIYYKLRNYRRAMADFKKATDLERQNKTSWNHLGLCLNALGSSLEAVEAHGRALKYDPNFKEAWVNMAQAYKDLGIGDKAEHVFQQAISLDPAYVHAYQLRAVSRFGCGDHRGALDDLNTALQIEPNMVECRHMRGVVKHGLGLLKEAVKDYQAVSAAKPEHVAWYQREIALFCQRHLDKPLNSFNIDVGLDEDFKEAWCKRNHPALLARYKPLPGVKTDIADVTLIGAPSNEQQAALLAFARKFGPRLQNDCAGYLPNKRQHAACGYAVLELAQRLKALWFNNDTAVAVKSRSRGGGKKPLCEGPFGWRDAYDILIRWRQFSEMNDPVWWVDLLSRQQFEEGFGSHTPMITGQCNVVRYYPMFPRAFKIMKELIKEQTPVSDDKKEEAQGAKDCKEMHEIMGRDFFVITPCYSTASPGKKFEGTRLTLQESKPEGYEFSIRTPGTPSRWAEFDTELSFVWQQLCEAVADKSKTPASNKRVHDLILTMAFYWYNFMPLSRGTAAVGYMGILAMFLAIGLEVSTPIPKDFQVDWEGILTPRAEDFVATVSKWLYPALKPLSIESLPLVSHSVQTLRTLLTMLNLYC